MSGPSAEGPVRPDIVGFLRARLDEDGAAARISPRDNADDPMIVGAWAGKSESNLYVQYYARMNPARVLREVEAKRRIVDEYERWQSIALRDDDQRAATYALGILAAVYLLALPFADHPDYDPAWRPS